MTDPATEVIDTAALLRQIRTLVGTEAPVARVPTPTEVARLVEAAEAASEQLKYMLGLMKESDLALYRCDSECASRIMELTVALANMKEKA